MNQIEDSELESESFVDDIVSNEDATNDLLCNDPGALCTDCIACADTSESTSESCEETSEEESIEDIDPEDIEDMLYITDAISFMNDPNVSCGFFFDDDEEDD